MDIESREFKKLMKVANQHFRGISIGLRSHNHMVICKWAAIVCILLNVILSYDIPPEKYVDVFEEFLTKIYDGKFNWHTYPSLAPIEGIFSHNFNPTTFSLKTTNIDRSNMRTQFSKLPNGYSRFCLGISNVHEDDRIEHFFMLIVYKNPSGSRMFIASASASALAKFEFSVKEIEFERLMDLFTEIVEPQPVTFVHYPDIQDKPMVQYFYDPKTATSNPKKSSVKEYVHYQNTSSTPLLFIIHGIESILDTLFQEMFSYSKKVNVEVRTRRQTKKALLSAKPGGGGTRKSI